MPNLNKNILRFPSLSLVTLTDDIGITAFDHELLIAATVNQTTYHVLEWRKTNRFLEEALFRLMESECLVNDVWLRFNFESQDGY